jgi:hypothetical protein
VIDLSASDRKKRGNLTKSLREIEDVVAISYWFARPMRSPRLARDDSILSTFLAIKFLALKGSQAFPGIHDFWDTRIGVLPEVEEFLVILVFLLFLSLFPFFLQIIENFSGFT